MSRRFSVGPNENAFNTKAVELINGCDISCATAEKIPGTKFNPGLPDIIGGIFSTSFYLENKYALPVARRRPDTILVGTGCADKKKTWSVRQQRTLIGFANALGDAVIGGLIAVKGTEGNPDLVIGVDMQFVRAGALTAADIHCFWETWPGKQFFRLYGIGKKINDKTVDVVADIFGVIHALEK